MNAVTPELRGSWVVGAGAAFALAVLAGALLFWRLGAYPLTDGDAGYYGRVARNVIESGDWGVLRFDPANPTSDVDKPPLGIWMTAVVFRAFGPTDVVARAWHGLVALGLLGLTAALAARVSGRRAVLLAPTVLLTSGLFFYQAREAMLDVPLAVCLTLAMWLVCGAGPARFWARYYAACAVVGLGVMIKGPVAAALVAVPFAMMVAGAGRNNQQAFPRIAARALGGVCIVLAVALPWHVLVFSRAGASFADMYVGTLSWRRYLDPQFPPGVAIVPYAGLTLVGLLPWAGLAIPALWVAWGERRSQPGVALLCAYILWAIVFFGLSPGKIIIRYILPIVPAFAVLIAAFLSRPPSRALRGAALATIIIGAALVPAGVYVDRLEIGVPGAGPVLCTFVFLLAAVMVAGGVVLRRRLEAGVVILAGGAAAAYVVLMIQALPIVTALYPERAIARVINDADGQSARVAVFKAVSPETMLSFYLDARLERLATDDELARFLSEPGRGWIVERPDAPLPPAARRMMVTIDDRGRAVLLGTRK